jgi:hypothetical protein
MTDTTLTYDDELERLDRENAFNNHHWSAAKECIAKGDKAHAKADDLYITAGQHLKVLKANHDGRGGTFDAWEALLKERVGIGKTRASELMQIADGTKTVEQIRDRSNESSGRSHAKARLRSPLISGENSGNVETVTTSIDTKGRKQGAEVPPEVAEARARSAAKIRALLGNPDPPREEKHELIAAEIKKKAEPAPPDEELALLREFATFILTRAKTVSVNPGPDLAAWKTLRGKVQVMLGVTP